MFVNNTVPAATIKCTADPYLEFGVAGIWEACRRDQSFISHQRSILPQHGAADWDESKKKKKKEFFFSLPHQSERNHSPETRVKLFITAHRFPVWLQTNTKTKKWRTAREARRLFRGILPLLEDCPLFWKRFFFKANGGDITHSPPN